MKRLLLVAVLALAACGEQSSVEIVDDGSPAPYPTYAPPSYGPPPTGPSSSAPPPPPAVASCDTSKPFGALQRVPGLANVDAANPSLTFAMGGAERAIWFDVAGPDGKRAIQLATRATSTSAFGAPLDVNPLVPGTGDEVDARPSPYDATTFVASNGGNGTFAIYASNGGVATLLEGLDTPANETQPFLFDSELWFASDRGGQYAIYRAAYVGGTAQAPVLVDELDAPGFDGYPVLTQTGLEIYFASARDDADGTHGIDIFRAVRSNTGARFGAPTRVDELSSTGTDTPGWISADDCRLYFTSDRGGVQRLYLAERL